MPDGGLAREDLASLLQDLPSGQHIMAYADMSYVDALRACEVAAKEAGEQWLLHGIARETLPPDLAAAAETFPEFSPETWRGLLDEACSCAKQRGKSGILLTIFAETRLQRQGPQAHLDAEATLGGDAPPHARVICIYTPPARQAMARRLPQAEESHSLVYTVMDAA